MRVANGFESLRLTCVEVFIADERGGRGEEWARSWLGFIYTEDAATSAMLWLCTERVGDESTRARCPGPTNRSTAGTMTAQQPR